MSRRYGGSGGAGVGRGLSKSAKDARLRRVAGARKRAKARSNAATRESTEHRGHKSRPKAKARATTKAGKRAAATKKAETRSQRDRRETIALERGMRKLDGKRPLGPNPKAKPGKKNSSRGGLTGLQKQTMRAMNQQSRGRKKVASKSRRQKQKSRAVNEGTKWNWNLAERMAFEAGNYQRMTRLSANPRIPQQRSWNNNYGKGKR